MLGGFLLLRHELAHEVAQKLRACAVAGLGGRSEPVLQRLVDPKAQGSTSPAALKPCLSRRAASGSERSRPLAAHRLPARACSSGGELALVTTIEQPLHEGAHRTVALGCELTNVLRTRRLRRRLTAEKAQRVLARIALLPIGVDRHAVPRRELLALALRFGLSSCDAAYLELGLRHQLPLATQDDALRSAALAAGVGCIEAPAQAPGRTSSVRAKGKT